MRGGAMGIAMLIDAVMFLFKIALIIGGIITLVRAREAASWDKGVVKMSIGSGLFCLLLGLFLLVTGCP